MIMAGMQLRTTTTQTIAFQKKGFLFIWENVTRIMTSA